MNLESSEGKTPENYRAIAQLTTKGLSSDFTNQFFYRVPLDTIAMLESTPDKKSKAKEFFNTVVTALKETPTYSERYLNGRELQKASEHGVKKEDLINTTTKPAIKRLDEMALRCRQIGVEITLENYQGFARELAELYREASILIKG